MGLKSWKSPCCLFFFCSCLVWLCGGGADLTGNPAFKHSCWQSSAVLKCPCGKLHISASCSVSNRSARPHFAVRQGRPSISRHLLKCFRQSGCNMYLGVHKMKNVIEKIMRLTKKNTLIYSAPTLAIHLPSKMRPCFTGGSFAAFHMKELQGVKSIFDCSPFMDKYRHDRGLHGDVTLSKRTVLVQCFYEFSTSDNSDWGTLCVEFPCFYCSPCAGSLQFTHSGKHTRLEYVSMRLNCVCVLRWTAEKKSDKIYTFHC